MTPGPAAPGPGGVFEAIIRRGTLMTVIVGVVCVLGVVAVLRIPIQMIPNLEVSTITVRTSWPGATPQDVEKEILIEQEEFLRAIPSLHRIVATAESGEATIELEFPYGVDVTQTLIRVNNALSQVPSYPANVDQPRIFAESFSSNSFMYFRVSPLDGNPRQLDMVMMRDFVDDHVRARMENVPGVARVELWSGAERQIQILADPAALAERGLTVSDVRDALTARNRDVSGGNLEAGKRRYLVRTVGRFEGPGELERLILARRGDAVIRLGDVARVRLDHSEVRRDFLVNGKPALGLAVNRELGSNVIEIKEAMLAEAERINEQVLNPEGMQLALNATDTVYVEQSIATVWRNLAIGAVLATLVMFAFLRSGRATLVGVIGIPVCTIAAFLGLLATGRTINVISLAGVAFSIGMTLDNSIVVLESIELERRRGLDRVRAAAAGVRRVWPAVLASTLTTVLVFTPIVFIDEEAGQLYGDIAVGVAAAILASMLVAITVIPTAAANIAFRAATGDGEGEGDDGGSGGGRGSGLRRAVLAVIGWIIGGPVRRAACIGGTVAASAAIIFGLTPAAEYLPPGEEPKIFARMNAPPGYNLETMRRIGRGIQDELLPYLDDAPDAFARGETDVPAIAYMILSIDPGGVQIIGEPKRPDDVDALMDAIDARFERRAGMRAFTTRGSIITSNQGTTRSVDLDIAGPSLADVYAAANAAYRRANEVFDDPRIQADPPTLTLSQPLVEVRPDWDRAAELGLDAADIGFTVAALTDGAFVDEFFLADDKIDVYLYGAEGANADLEGLADLPVHTPGGPVVPLSSLARVVETVDTSVIRRVDARRTVTLSIIPPESVPLESGVRIVREDVLGELRAGGAIPASAREAVREAVDSRLRPIAMSALTTMFGLAPLVFIPGAGTELYRGVGAIVLFGLAGAAIVTLTFLPALAVWVLGRRERGGSARAPARSDLPGMAASSSPLARR